jgi:diadenosine tetraphosphate (Ap4A) HIT family hydrolase
LTRILEGSAPGRLLWSDESAFCVLHDHPIRVGHVVVAPRREVEHWIDLPPDLLRQLFAAAARIGRALQDEFEPTRVGLLIASLAVRHAHLHLIPIDRPEDLDLARQDPSPDPAALDAAAERIRARLR